MNNDKFVLTHGIWKNKEHTSSSEVTFHNSYDDAIRELDEHEKFYARFGYTTLYANVVHPDGTITTLK
jgi:hypothetical protein